ncbi:YczE/YyaS/YitT family protein [Serinicoccus marinus]|uniref:membrane protein YczE n=1 Tax=Serinicoccus marinus TaxID=247333 RepID=UPI0003B30B50|nr:membrane protein [Serinicoccus marinus]
MSMLTHVENSRAVTSARRRAADPRRQLAALGPVEQLRAGRLGRRIPQLLVGLALYGASIALMVRGVLGNMPWDVLHQGVTRHVPLSLGVIIIAVSVLVLLLWVPLRQSPGLGTIANALLVGLAADATLWVVAPGEGWVVRGALMAAGVLLNGVASAMYIGAQLGPGPRDGLMTGLARRTGWSLRLVRTGIEVTVIALGWLLGGVVGLGTVVYAVAIGPLTQALLPWFTVDLGDRARR